MTHDAISEVVFSKRFMSIDGRENGEQSGTPSRSKLRFDNEDAPAPELLRAALRSRGRRHRIDPLIRRYVTHSDRSPEDADAFRRWNDERSIGIVRVLGVVFVAMIVLSWPADLRFRGEHQVVFDAFLIWRSAAVALLAPFIIAHRIPILRREPLRVAMIACIGFIAVLGYSMGRIAGLDAPWFYVLYAAAWLTVVFPFGLVERLGWVLAVSIAAVTAYFAPFPEHFEHPHVAVPIVNLATFSLVAALVGHIVHHLVRDNFYARREVEAERARAELLLRNMLPDRVARQLKRVAGPVGDRFESATVLFADIVSFTPLAGRVAPEALLRFLNDLFTQFDLIAERHGLEKIKTTGDSYVVAGGVPDPRPDHAEAVADMALEMMAAVDELRAPGGEPVQLRIGIQSGPLVAGVIGVRRFTYDLWGDTVNIASRLESQGIPGRIQVGEACATQLRGAFELEPRGRVALKGKGEVFAWFLLGRSIEQRVPTELH